MCYNNLTGLKEVEMPKTKTETAGGTPATPNVRREMSRTGREPGEGVGDSTPSAGTAGIGSSGNRRTSAPSGADKDLWSEAERQWRNQGGGAGVDTEAKQAAIQDRYDQMVENDKSLKKWAGEDGILGDV